MPVCLCVCVSVCGSTLFYIINSGGVEGTQVSLPASLSLSPSLPPSLCPASLSLSSEFSLSLSPSLSLSLSLSPRPPPWTELNLWCACIKKRDHFQCSFDPFVPSFILTFPLVLLSLPAYTTNAYQQ